jgi:hypothetical protein
VKLPTISFTGPPPTYHRVGLDIEALPMVSWHAPPIHRHVVCFGYGPIDDVRYIETVGRRPGRFRLNHLREMREYLVHPDTVVVGHNAYRFDLPAVNGVLIAHGLDPLPAMKCQDTMGVLKTGYAFRNTLKAQCKKYGVALKGGSPDWDLVMMGDAAEWDKMRAYNIGDVVCTLELERALTAAGLAPPVRIWRPTK